MISSRKHNKKKFSIKKKLLTTLIPLLIFLFWLFMLLNLFMSTRLITDSLETNGLNLAEHIANEFRNTATSCEVTSNMFVSILNSCDGFDLDYIESAMKKLLLINNDISGAKLLLLDDPGKPLREYCFYYSYNGFVSKKVKDLYKAFNSGSKFKELILEKKSIWSEPFIDRLYGENYVISFMQPVIKNGKLKGLVSFDLSLSKLVEKTRIIDKDIINESFMEQRSSRPLIYKLLFPGTGKKINISRYGYTFITSSTGKNISNPIIDEREANNHYMGSILENQNRELIETVLKYNNSKKFIKITDPLTLKKGYLITTDLDNNITQKTSPDWDISVIYFEEVFQSIKNLFYGIFISISLLIVIFMILVIYRTSSSVSAPLEKLALQAEKYSSSNFGDSLEENKGPLEIVTLSKAFNALGKKVKQKIHSYLKTQREAIYLLSRAEGFREFGNNDEMMRKYLNSLNRISRYAGLIGDRTLLSNEEKKNLYYASRLHDIGKISLSDNILMKTHVSEKLTPQETVEFNKYPEKGAELLKGSESELLKMAAVISLNQHENWDGSGYPGHKKEKEIPLVARIIAICNAFEDLTCRKKMTVDKALETLHERAGKQFDPELVFFFEKSRTDIIKILSLFGPEEC
jgi:HD-GYP domain-containing protein (c-di-GMP phosphodiesterase class II)